MRVAWFTLSVDDAFTKLTEIMSSFVPDISYIRSLICTVSKKRGIEFLQ